MRTAEIVALYDGKRKINRLRVRGAVGPLPLTGEPEEPST